MKRFILALQFLTRLPAPRVTASEADFAASMRWFPAVGLVVGLLVAGAGWLGALFDPWTGALAALAMWVGVTGALHLDGLADITDAAGAAHKGREHVSAVLADPHVGSFGIVALILQIAAKLVLLHAVVTLGLFPALILIPAAARIGPLLWTLSLPSLHAGLGARFAAAVGFAHVAFWYALLLPAAFVSPALLATPLLILLWGRRLLRTLGGISGDGHGAGIELVETGLLLAILLWAHIA